MDRDEVEVHKNAKRELGQCPAILTSRLVNNIYLLFHKAFLHRRFPVEVFGFELHVLSAPIVTTKNVRQVASDYNEELNN